MRTDRADVRPSSHETSGSTPHPPPFDLVGQNPAESPILLLCDRVRESAFSLHRWLRHGHPERVYENGLANRLTREGISFSRQHRLAVFDEDGTALGASVVDLLLEDSLIVEVKACQTLVPEHTAQVLGYLRASRLRHGLLINFGASRLQLRKLIL